MFSAPGSWLSLMPGADRVAAGYELMYRLGKDYEKPQFGISEVDVGGAKVQVVEQTVMTKPFCRLLRFKRYSDDADIVAGLQRRSRRAGRRAAVGPPLHAAARDRAHPARDHKVYITDWVDARMVPRCDRGAFTLDDYVGYHARVHPPHRRRPPARDRVCQPTVPVLAAVSLMAARGEPEPRSLTLMGGPIDTRRNPTQVNRLATSKPLEWFETNLVHSVPANYPATAAACIPASCSTRASSR